MISYHRFRSGTDLISEILINPTRSRDPVWDVPAAVQAETAGEPRTSARSLLKETPAYCTTIDPQHTNV